MEYLLLEGFYGIRADFEFVICESDIALIGQTQLIETPCVDQATTKGESRALVFELQCQVNTHIDCRIFGDKELQTGTAAQNLLSILTNQEARNKVDNLPTHD